MVTVAGVHINLKGLRELRRYISWLRRISEDSTKVIKENELLMRCHYYVIQLMKHEI